MSAATAESTAITAEYWQALRDAYLRDPWLFALDICGFDRLVERFHKPLIYLFTHQTALLIEVLKGPLRSTVITKIKRELRRKNLDFTNPRHFDAIDKFLLKLNVRIFRKAGKTSCGEAGILWDITVNPDHAWALVSRDDDAASAMCAMIGQIIQDKPYRFFFPDRIPPNEKENITKFSILLAGRTKKLPQPCVTAGGVDSGWVSGHFDRIYGDDLTGLENKSGPKLKVVREFQSNRGGLKIPEWDDPFYDFTTGTRWARKDDSWVLEQDPECVTIYVMIEERDGPVTFGNMLEAGEPTLPEWFDAEKVAEEKADYLRDPELGALALLANLFLTIPSDGSKVFNDDIVDSRKFQWVEEDDKLYIARLADAKKPNGKILRFLPKHMERRAGADPSSSMTGDKWGVTCIGRDPGGVHHQLRTITGRGVEGFLDTLLYIDERYDPEKIGIERAAMQEWVLVAISKDIRFQNILHKFVGVPTNEKSKRSRAENLVAAPMEMGQLYLNPDDHETPVEMKEWDPDNRKAKDASIDSIGVAMALFDTPATGQTTREIEEMAHLDNQRYMRSVDPDFGVPIENVFSDEDLFIDDMGDYDYDEAVAY